MVSFRSDYTNGACKEVLDALVTTNNDVLPGYGTDSICDDARNAVRDFVGQDDADVFFAVGGTQANALVIGTLLENYQGVIAAKTGHISMHEGGAIEFTGHKVIELSQKDGKIDADELEKYLRVFYADENNDKMVYPGMLYISHPTEYGTLYSLSELERLSSLCREFDMKFFIDGARLGYGLASRDTDVTINDISRLSDVFYIGGTKCGALCGEAIVYKKGVIPSHFNTVAKQRGAVVAKGRLLGVQFKALFTDDTYMRISRHAIDMAMRIRDMFVSKGYRMFIDSPTNQQFVILEDSFMASLKEKVGFEFWEKYDENHTVVRFASSWSTTEDDLKYLESLI